jgi:hypothetical protein
LIGRLHHFQARQRQDERDGDHQPNGEAGDLAASRGAAAGPAQPDEHGQAGEKQEE